MTAKSRLASSQTHLQVITDSPITIARLRGRESMIGLVIAAEGSGNGIPAALCTTLTAFREPAPLPRLATTRVVSIFAHPGHFGGWIGSWCRNESSLGRLELGVCDYFYKLSISVPFSPSCISTPSILPASTVIPLRPVSRDLKSSNGRLTLLS